MRRAKKLKVDFHERLKFLVRAQYEASEHGAAEPSITPEEAEVLQAYSWLEKGILPLSGGYLLQPFRYVEAMGILMNEFACLERDIRRKAETQNGSKTN